MTISSIALIIKESEKTLADIVYQHLFIFQLRGT